MQDALSFSPLGSNNRAGVTILRGVRSKPFLTTGSLSIFAVQRRDRMTGDYYI